MADEEPGHLQRLNPEQFRAVTTTKGPLLILAGAGSGKTRVLTRRIAQLLHTGTDPKEILAVTFTNKAASEMKERVHELVGDIASNVWVSTFHSTCCRILRMDIEAIGFTRRFAIYDDDDQLRLLKSLIDVAGLDRDKAPARDMLSRIDHYKNRMQSVDDVLRERRSHINDPLIRIWREYDEALRAADALDFNDLIGKTVELLQTDEAIRDKWRERFQYVMVDEYQDTNNGQYTLLRLLSDGHRNLAVVGDDDQSIYGFRGADISNILNFEKDYPEATVVRLEQNYRSSGHILTLANAVVAHNTGRLPKKLWTQAPDGPKVQMMVAETPRDEARKVANALLTLRRRGHDWSECSIIYRTNAIAIPFEAALRSSRIPYKVVGGKKFYERREVRDILAYMRLLVNPNDDAAFMRVVNVPARGVGPKTQTKLRDDASKRGQPLLSTARVRGEGRTKGEKGIHAFAKMITELTDRSQELDLSLLVSEVLDRSGYVDMLKADTDSKDKITRDAQTRLTHLDELVADAAAFRAPEEATRPAEKLAAWLDRIALTAQSDEKPEGGEVTLMTVHSSKGLEYPIVFVVQMNESVFPHARSLDNSVDEERRLAYVAFTRAMQRLVVTRSMQLGTRGGQAGGMAEPSRFLFGIPYEVCDGDLPDGDPVEDQRAKRFPSKSTKTKLNTFLAARAKKAPMPEEYTLIDIESMEDLHKGCQVHHPRYGLGEVRQLSRAGIYIRFGGAQRLLPLPAPGLQIVAD